MGGAETEYKPTPTMVNNVPTVLSIVSDIEIEKKSVRENIERKRERKKKKKRKRRNPRREEKPKWRSEKGLP